MIVKLVIVNSQNFKYTHMCVCVMIFQTLTLVKMNNSKWEFEMSKLDFFNIKNLNSWNSGYLVINSKHFRAKKEIVIWGKHALFLRTAVNVDRKCIAIQTFKVWRCGRSIQFQCLVNFLPFMCVCVCMWKQELLLCQHTKNHGDEKSSGMVNDWP